MPHCAPGGAGMTAEVTAQINNLLRGVNFSNVETVRDAWRELLDQGKAASPLVREKLRNPAWEKKPQQSLTDYFTIMLSLLCELDPDAGEQEIKRLNGRKLHPAYRNIAKSFLQRLQDRPATHIGPGVPVYIAPDIEDRDVVVANLERWSQTPQLELKGVTRIDIIARQPDFEYRGKYNLYFSGIILTWPQERVESWRLWALGLRAERTFYHEVGHHACGHMERGQVEEQEEEANDYARKMMRRSHPVLSRSLRAVRFIIKPLLRYFRKVKRRLKK